MPVNPLSFLLLSCFRVVIPSPFLPENLDLSSLYELQQHFDFQSDFDHFALQPLEIPHSSERCEEQPNHQTEHQNLDSYLVELQPFSLQSNLNHYYSPPSGLSSTSESFGKLPTAQAEHQASEVIQELEDSNRNTRVLCTSNDHRLNAIQTDLAPSLSNLNHKSPFSTLQATEKKNLKREPDRLENHQDPQQEKNSKQARIISYWLMIFTNSFRVITLQQQLTPSEEIAIDAISSLKRLDGNKLFNIEQQGGVKKMIRVEPTEMEEFFGSIFHLSHSRFGQETTEKNNINSKGTRYIQIVWAINKLQESSASKAKFYTVNLKFKYFVEQRDLMFKIRKKFPEYCKRTYQKRLDRPFSLLPLYMFYVDMINIILPKEVIDGGASLEEQRKVAVHRFLDFMERIFLKEIPTYPVAESKLIRDSSDLIQTTLDYSRILSLLWKVIRYWIMSSRTDLVINEGPGSRLKVFFNNLALSWIKECC